MIVVDTGDKLYYPPPTYILSYRQYQNVNTDKRLQDMVTKKFLKKLKGWLKNDPSYKSVSKFKKIIDKDEGYDAVHYILRILVKRGRTNWYDLDLQEELVKKYILFKLKEYV